MPVEIKGQRIRIPFDLAQGETRHVTMTVSSTGEPASPDRISFLRALKQSKRTARATVRRIRPLATSNAAFEAWLDRSASDLSLLVSQLSTGPYPYAGIPWFSAPFGRDAVVTAMQVLWLDPSIARGVLAHLSALQAAERRSSTILSQARSCMKCARARWPRFAKCHSADITAASIRRPSL